MIPFLNEPHPLCGSCAVLKPGRPGPVTRRARQRREATPLTGGRPGLGAGFRAAQRVKEEKLCVCEAAEPDEGDGACALAEKRALAYTIISTRKEM